MLRKEITAHLQQILRKPKVKLESEEYLVNASELDFITPRTIQHFMKDTTTWAKSTLNRPMPQQLLKEINEESIDIYENRFIFTFSFHLERSIRRTLKELKDYLHTINSKLKSNELQIELDILKFDAEFEMVELLNYQELFLEVESQLKVLYNLVRHVIKEFKGIKKIQGYIVPNQVLLYNKDYGTLYRYYNKYMKHDKSKQKKLNDCVDFQTYYTDEVFLNVISNLLDLGYESTKPIRFKMNAILEEYIFTKEAMQFTFVHQEQEVEIIVIRQPCFYSATPKFEVHLQIRRLNFEDNIILKLIPTLVQFHKYATNESINRLYEYPLSTRDPIVAKSKKAQEMAAQIQSSSTFVVYPAFSEEDYYKKIPYEQLHQLFTLGTNFIDSAKFQAYGTMKFGMLPFTSSDMSKLMFRRLIRLQLFKLGVRTHCFMCGEKGNILPNVTNEDYICSNPKCKCEWGVRSCSECGTPIYKMQKKKSNENDFLTEEEQQEFLNKSDLEWLIDRENINATMALANLCENANLGTSFFTICPNCGDCKQKSKMGRICRRCDAKARCTNMQI